MRSHALRVHTKHQCAVLCLLLPARLLPQERDVSYNVLEGPPQAAVLPGCISSLPALTTLRLTRCWLRSLPHELTALSNMALFDAR